ncbi:MAG: menaquinone biosynthesis protein [Phycisphaerae bacterium]|nr:menaquinone biosynthesis protein [Phycisphaerae bacterium]
MNDVSGRQNAVRIGAVSFLNARPLIEGLDAEPAVSVRTAVPARLGGMLHRGEVEAALVPVVDWARARGAWTLVSDACIASDGQTLTVRVFSRVPPEAVRCIHTDSHSHTSVVLARVIWRELYGRALTLRPLPEPAAADDCEAVLLIGDKVITAAPSGFSYDVDLGLAWKNHTGLPFVFAVWVAWAGGDWSALAATLSAARDRGTAAAHRIAHDHGPVHGWPVELAETYLTRYMQYRITAEARRGMERFIHLAGEAGFLDEPAAADAVQR